MTGGGWLLDANVIREFRPGGHVNVAAWRTGVPDTELFVSAMTIWEMRRGFEALRARDPARSARGLTALDALATDFADRIVPVDAAVAAEWARLLGEKDKDRTDVALAATARVLNLVLVTCNLRDFRGRGVHVLDPFKARLTIVEV